MAAKKEVEQKANQNWVNVKLPKAEKNEPNFQFVSINGKNYKVKKGEVVLVPREVAEVLLHSDEANEEADSYIEAILN